MGPRRVWPACASACLEVVAVETVLDVDAALVRLDEDRRASQPTHAAVLEKTVLWVRH